MQALDFDALTAAPVLGEGVFGRVLDLGDGTVLKLARDKCAGVGSGREKIQREHAALAILAEAQQLPGLVAVSLGHGDVPTSSLPGRDGFAVWLRMSKLPGRPISVDHVEDLSGTQQSALGDEIGIALARVQDGLGNALAAAGESATLIDDESGYGEIEAVIGELGDPRYQEAIAQLRKMRARIRLAILASPTHGDFNVSNLLFTPDRKVCGVLDLAEWGADFPEKDVADAIFELPMLTAAVIAAYERESGFKVDQGRLALGLAENALYAAVIAARRGDAEATQQNRELLPTHLARATALSAR
jgi:Ser/Thr protein kinase RdoA (MazF antagonist)